MDFSVKSCFNPNQSKIFILLLCTDFDAEVRSSNEVWPAPDTVVVRRATDHILNGSITKTPSTRSTIDSLDHCCEPPCIKSLQNHQHHFQTCFDTAAASSAWIFRAVLSATVLCVILAGLCMSSFHLGPRHGRPTLQPWDVRVPPGKENALSARIYAKLSYIKRQQCFCFSNCGLPSKQRISYSCLI